MVSAAAPFASSFEEAQRKRLHSNRIGYEWHTDGGGATILYSESAPEAPRRTTLFASGAAAFDNLPADVQAEAESIVMFYSSRFVTGDTATIDYMSGVRMAPNGLRLAQPAFPAIVSGRDRPPLKVERSAERAGAYVPGKEDHSRPLVRVHPHTGRKVLWQTAKNMEYISVGGVVLEPEASRLKLEEILSRVLATTDTDLVYEVRTAATLQRTSGATPGEPDPLAVATQHHWKAGDLLLMDNRVTMHSTTPYENGDADHGRQLMHHASMKAKRPQEGWTGKGPLRPAQAASL